MAVESYDSGSTSLPPDESTHGTNSTSTSEIDLLRAARIHVFAENYLEVVWGTTAAVAVESYDTGSTCLPTDVSDYRRVCFQY